MSGTVLVVDDEEGIVEFLELNLTREGFEVVKAYTGEEALHRTRDRSPDVVLLDVGLPDLDGFEVCRRIRHFSDVPVIMVTALEDDVDKIRGLETGADDYVVKPFNPKELVARIRANLRRVAAAEGKGATILSYGALTIDLMKRRVHHGSEIIELTPREYDLLTFFVNNPGKVLSREEILREVWGSEHLESRSVDVYVRNLREKLGEGARYIRTVWGKGYRFAE